MELNGRLRQTPWLHRKPEALQPVAIGHDGPRRSPLLEGGRNPGINIGGRGLRQVLIQGGLAGGHEHGETFEGAEYMVLRRHRILASAQIREIGRDPCLVLGTEKGHPTELWAGPEGWVGCRRCIPLSFCRRHGLPWTIRS